MTFTESVCRTECTVKMLIQNTGDLYVLLLRIHLDTHWNGI